MEWEVRRMEVVVASGCCCGKEGAELEGKALNLMSKLCSNAPLEHFEL